MGIMGLALAGTLGATAGGMAGTAMDKLLGGGQSTGPTNDEYVNGQIASMNNLLNTSMQQAMAASQAGTDQAAKAQKNYLAAAMKSYQSMSKEAQAAVDKGFAQSQALNAPIARAGYNALDLMQDSLGMQRPDQGNYALSQSLDPVANAQRNALNQQQQKVAQMAGQAGYTPGQVVAKPTLQQQKLFATPVNPINPFSYYSDQNGQLAYNYNGGQYLDPTAARQMQAQYLQQQAQYNKMAPIIAAKNAPIAAQNAAARAAYNQQMKLFTPYNQALGQVNQATTNLTPQQLQSMFAYNGQVNPGVSQVNVGPGGQIIR